MSKRVYNESVDPMDFTTPKRPRSVVLEDAAIQDRSAETPSGSTENLSRHGTPMDIANISNPRLPLASTSPLASDRRRAHKHSKSARRVRESLAAVAACPTLKPHEWPTKTYVLLVTRMLNSRLKCDRLSAYTTLEEANEHVHNYADEQRFLNTGIIYAFQSGGHEEQAAQAERDFNKYIFFGHRPNGTAWWRGSKMVEGQYSNSSLMTVEVEICELIPNHPLGWSWGQTETIATSLKRLYFVVSTVRLKDPTSSLLHVRTTAEAANAKLSAESDKLIRVETLKLPCKGGYWECTERYQNLIRSDGRSSLFEGVKETWRLEIFQADVGTQAVGRGCSLRRPPDYALNDVAQQWFLQWLSLLPDAIVSGLLAEIVMALPAED